MSELLAPVKMKRLCLMLELKSDRSLIEDYERYHKPGNVWDETSGKWRPATCIFDLSEHRD